MPQGSWTVPEQLPLVLLYVQLFSFISLRAGSGSDCGGCFGFGFGLDSTWVAEVLRAMYRHEWREVILPTKVIKTESDMMTAIKWTIDVTIWLAAMEWDQVEMALFSWNINVSNAEQNKSQLHWMLILIFNESNVNVNDDVCHSDDGYNPTRRQVCVCARGVWIKIRQQLCFYPCELLSQSMETTKPN